MPAAADTRAPPAGSPATAPRHLVIGATGVAGDGVVRHLAAASDAPVFALSRRGTAPQGLHERVTGVPCDVLAPGALEQALATHRPTHVYYTAHAHPAGNAGDLDPRAMQAMLGLAKPFAKVWDALPLVGPWVYGQIGRRAGIVDDGRNGAIFDAVAAALRSPAGQSVEHLAVLTGGRLYGVHLGPDLYPGFPARLVEDSPRHPGPSWYFAVEDAAQALAAEGRIGVSIHRPHFILAAVQGAPYSLVNGVGVYAALCREVGADLVFLGGRRVYEARFEAASAELIGAQMRWAAATPAARGEAFNVSNGEPLRWSEVWPAVAARFGLRPVVPDAPTHARKVVGDLEAAWRAMRQRHGMAEMSLASAFPQAFLHQSMIMTWDTHYDIGKCRAMGFVEARDQAGEFLRLFERLQAQGVLPPADGAAGLAGAGG